MNPQTMQKLIGAGIVVFVLVLVGSQSIYIVEPGNRGVRVTLGKVSEVFVSEGPTFKLPLVTQIHQISVKQQTQQMTTECYTSDLQQVNAELRVLYRIPEASIVELWKNYQSDDSLQPAYFQNLIRPRVTEALKEAVATENSELIVQKRETVKNRTLESARTKLGKTSQGAALISIADITLQGIGLSPELTVAIEQKMIQEQEAKRAKFVQDQTRIEAETAIIKAEGEAESIRLRGEALRQNPVFIDLEIVEKWDGQSPLVVSDGAEGGVPVMIPVDPFNDPSSSVR